MFSKTEFLTFKAITSILDNLISFNTTDLEFETLEIYDNLYIYTASEASLCISSEERNKIKKKLMREMHSFVE